MKRQGSTQRHRLHVIPLCAALVLASAPAFSQTPFSCQSDYGGTTVCTTPATVLYGVFVPAGGFYGRTREEACLKYAAAVPNPNRGAFFQVAPYQSNLYYCVFQFGTYPNGDPAYGFDGDNREVKTCPINSVMLNSSGQLAGDNYLRPGTLFMAPPYVGSALPDNSALYPTTVKVLAGTSVDYNNVTCSSRGAVVPAQEFGPSCNDVGNPINAASGIKSHRERDYAANGLVLSRTYNSGAGAIHFDIPYGRGWQLSYGMHLTAAGGVTISRPTGRLVQFAASGTAWISWPDSKANLVEVKDASNVRTGWKFVDGELGQVEAYAADGLPRAITTVDGSFTTLSYADGSAAGANGGVLEGTATPVPRGALISATNHFGVALKFFYDTGFRLVRALLPDGSAVRYSYDARGNLASVTYPGTPAGAVRTFLYENATFPYALTGVIDESGNRYATYGYDTTGQANTTEHAGGADRYTLVLGATSTTVTDPLGSARVYGFANTFGSALRTSLSQPGGSGCGPSASALTYDANANVASRTDFNGVKTCYAYDLSRNLETKRVEGVAGATDCAIALTSPPAGSRVISTQWHPDWRLETRIAEPSRITTTTYNGQGATCAPSAVLVDGKPPAVVCSRSEQATTDATGSLGFGAGLSGTARTWSTTYTTYGRMLTTVDPNGKTTTTTYYPDDDPDLGRRGNVATVTNAANHVTRITAYNLHGQPTQIVDPNGLVTDLTYDLRMRLTSRKVGNELTGFTYDPRGLLTNVALPDGAGVTYSYDAAHRLIAIADQQGNRIDYTLDAVGNRIAERATDSGGTLVRNLQRTIDALNRVQQVTGMQ